MAPSVKGFACLAIVLGSAGVTACDSDVAEGTGAGGSGAGSTTTGNGGSAANGGAGSGASGGAPGCMEVPAGVPDDCITDVGAGEHDFPCDGLDYAVSVPDACVGCACGLVMDVHGLTMSGEMEEANTGMAAIGRERGYIVVQPTASGNPAAWNPGNDDPKVFDFMQRTIAAFHVDGQRVHFTGFSQGGDMSWRFLCDHSDILASVAPAAFNNDNDACFSDGVAPPNPRPILYMHGTSDALVSFSTAETSRDRVINAESLGQGMIVASDDDHVWTRYEGANGELFEMLEHDYSGAVLLDGHCFPGSTDPGGASGQLFPFGCDPPNAFVWGQVAMDFFVAHPMP